MHSTKRSPNRNVFGLLVMVVLTLCSIVWTINNANQFFGASDRTWAIKIPLMVSLIMAFIFSYGIFLNLYASWAKKTKRQLIELLNKDRRVVYEKYSRYFINEQLVIAQGYKATTFTKLSQKDIRNALSFAYQGNNS